MKINYKLKNAIMLVITFAIVGVLFYILNIYTPLYADDYSYIYSCYDGSRIDEISDIPISQYYHYQTTNGRFVTHSLAQFFLLIGKQYFNIINVFAYLLLGLLIYYHAVGTLKNTRIVFLVLIYCVLFLATPAFGQSFLWLDGSATYLYGVIIGLLYLLPYRKALYAVKNGTYRPNGKVIGFFQFLVMQLVGIVAGNTVENLSAALIIMNIAYIFWFVFHKVHIKAWMLGFGNIIGAVSLLLSPGTIKRINGTGGVSIGGVLKNIIFIGIDFVSYLCLPLLIMAMSFVLCSIGKKFFKLPCIADVVSLVKKYDCTIIYGLGTLASAFSMILSPQFPERAWSSVVSIMIITLLSFTYSSRKEIQTYSIYLVVLSFFLVISSLGTYVNAYFELKSTYCFNSEREKTIQAYVESGEKEVSVSAIASRSPYSVFLLHGDLVWDSDSWPNTAMAKYYGVDRIIRQQGDFHN